MYTLLNATDDVVVNEPDIIVDPDTSNWAFGVVLLILINPLLLPEP